MQGATAEYFTAKISNEKTGRAIEGTSRCFAVGAWRTASHFTPVHVAAYRDQLVKAGKEQTTVTVHPSAIRPLCEHMGASGAMVYNPARGV